ncbi:hypothetical protein LWI29_001334 [Acer saccharum]|uniref:DUF1664 domain-containing protein n=1 Tax=Acer saccharum TaxID=4024 RepID=A0AA39VQ64_ACESA|nr:hypothetical protein LWI29_001334 [Acer saccharum]
MALQAVVSTSKVLILLGAGLTSSIVLRSGRLSEIISQLQELLKGVEEVEISPFKYDSSLLAAQGLSFLDVMFVTKNNMANAVATVSKQLENVSEALASTKRHLSKRLENLDWKVEEQMETSKLIANDITSSPGRDNHDTGISRLDIRRQNVYVTNHDVRRNHVNISDDWDFDSFFNLRQPEWDHRRYSLGYEEVFDEIETLLRYNNGRERFLGLSFSDVMFVTKNNMANAVATVSKQLENVSEALASTKRHLSKRLENLDWKVEQMETSKLIANDAHHSVEKSLLWFLNNKMPRSKIVNLDEASGSVNPRMPARGRVSRGPALNPDFEEWMRAFGVKECHPERGIDVSELGGTQIPTVV